MSNTDIARRAAPLADALAAYDHLPAVSNLSVTRDRSTLYFWRDHAGDRALGEWAASFGVPIVLDVSRGGLIRAQVNLSGHEVALSAPARRKAYELGTVAGIPVGADGQLTLTAEQLLNALDIQPTVDHAPHDVASEVNR